jgi:tRNA threonylcarbamoyladenosine biosynthesis protein TsaB
MACILNLETSTEVCSVAIACDGDVISSRENLTGQDHARFLTVFINEILEESKINIQQIDAVAISGGPGSYTGLRIGASVAKGICYALHLPLIEITSLESMAHHVINNCKDLHPVETKNVLFCPMIDARRMEVYTSFYDMNGVQIREIQADIVDHQSFKTFLENNVVLFFGNGADKCRNTISNPNGVFLNAVYSSAKNMVPLAEQKFKIQNFVNVAYYEPLYLKDFIATIPVKNIFGGIDKN